MLAKITQTHRRGLTVLLANGAEGFVSRQEITWSHINPRPHTLYRVGQTVEVTLLGVVRNNQAMVSIKRSKEDPWEKAQKTHSDGMEAIATVTSIFENGVYVEWEEGVGGFIPPAEIGIEKIRSGVDAVSLGDVIRVKIVGQKMGERCFLCSNRAAIEAIRSRHHSEANDLDIGPHRPQPSLAKDHETGSLRILLVDDDDEFCSATKRLFQLSGHQMETTTDPAKGIELALAGDYDIVVVDLVMPNLRGTDVCKKIREKDSNIALAIFTGESSIAHEELADITPPPLVLHKPFEIADVEAAIFEDVLPEMKVASESEPVGEVAQVQIKSPQLNQDPDKYVALAIDEVASRISHSAMGIFRWDETERSLKLVSGIGLKYDTKRGQKRQMERQLYYSPLKDIAEDKEIINIPNVSLSTVGFRKWASNLLTYTEFFESFYGLPIVVSGVSKYVVFFAHALPGKFPKTAQTTIGDRVHAISAELEKRQAQEQAAAMQRLALRGELTASLTHEIRNRLHIISMNLKSMNKLGPKAAHLLRERKADIPKEFEELLAITKESQEVVGEIGEVVTAFSEDLSERSQTEFDLSHALSAVVSRVRPLGQRHRVNIIAKIPDKCTVSGPPARLSQVFENLLINAIQHTAIFRKSGGEVQVSGGVDAETGKYFVEVRDNGEGIHARHLEKIFEMGFSTKEKGSGVGLALCAAAMRAVSGRVFVVRSVLFEGTIMKAEWGGEQNA